ncbi:MAG: TlpA disulfide reductase family protein [Pseudomonadota bacterium]
MHKVYTYYFRKCLGLIALVLCLTSTAYAIELNSPSPDFSLRSNDGINLRLGEQRGQVVMINFWASWCGPCRQEMPLLDAMYQQFKPLGFTVLGVNVEQDTKPAKNMLKSTPVTFPILFDDQNLVSQLYQVQAMPTTILVDRDGNMRYLHKGYKPGYEVKYEEQVRKLLRE